MLDPFLGIGNSAVAAQRCGVKKFIGFEIDEAYLAEAKRRLRSTNSRSGATVLDPARFLEEINHSWPDLRNAKRSLNVRRGCSRRFFEVRRRLPFLQVQLFRLTFR